MTSQIVALFFAAATPDPATLREGDILFQTSGSGQSRAISLATKSRWTHVGMLVIEGGKPLVLEAVQPVKTTPLAKWVARGEGGIVVVKRLRDALPAEALAKMKELGRGMRGKDYDLGFAWDDERLYCSELVYKLYDRGAGIRLGRVQELGDFDLSHPLVAAKVRERWGETVPKEMPVISPQALFEAPELVTVFAN